MLGSGGKGADQDIQLSMTAIGFVIGWLVRVYVYSVKNTEFSRIQLELLCCTLLLMELLLSLCRLVYLEMRLPHGASFAEASFLARNTSSLPDLVLTWSKIPGAFADWLLLLYGLHHVWYLSSSSQQSISDVFSYVHLLRRCDVWLYAVRMGFLPDKKNVMWTNSWIVLH